VSFTHLHLHTGYSFLDGAIRMEELCQTVANRGMDSVAVTDHGHLHGMLDFYQSAQKTGIKPIMGSEVYILPEGCSATERKREDLYHMVLLAENQTGWMNLKKVVSRGYTEGFYYKPRIDWKMLEEHSEGIIATTACLGGPLSRIYNGWEGTRKSREGRSPRKNPDKAREVAKNLASIFGKDNFFLELQDNGETPQYPYNEFLLELGEDLGLNCVGTADAHYVDPEHAEAHRYLMCIQRRQTVEDFAGHAAAELYIKTSEQIRSGWFKDHQFAIDNAAEIGARCNVSLRTGDIFLPPFPCAEGRDETAELEVSVRAGMQRRFDEMLRSGSGIPDRDAYEERLQRELGIINQMGFPGYFLIVQDFINWAKDHNIRVGPGRGSGAGSLVAWALRITDLDPLPYDLLFERFLNPERVSMPDFDVDFCQERRGEVIEYVTEKYGKERVGQIATFARLGGKSVIKDVASTMAIPFSEVNELTRSIPAFHEGLPVSLTPKFKGDGIELRDGRLVGDKESVAAGRKSWGLFEVSDKLVQMRDSNPRFRKTFEIASQLEGLYRQAGTHAGGVVIGEDPLTAYSPVFGGGEGVATQFNMEGVEQVGLVKFDFLGLKNLDIISYAEDLINEAITAANAAGPTERTELIASFPHLVGCDAGEELPALDIDLLPLDNSAVYKLISAGDTNGIFQLESDGMKKMLVDLKPDCFEDIIAAVALYRPGPMDQIPDYIARKHGRLAIEYPHPSMEELLKPTYGHMVYQEQVMQSAQIIGGYTLGGADILRRAMGKKKRDEMDRQRGIFCAGAKDLHGMKKADALRIFAVMEKFAGYGFNKSHAAAYAKISYQTAYLKRFHPLAFYCAQVTVHRANTETVTKYLREASEGGLSVLPPCVNASDYGFRPEGKDSIRFGLSAIKGLGDAVLDRMFETRKEKPFSGLVDLVDRCGPRKVPKKSMTLLADAGALDFVGVPRRRVTASLELTYNRAGRSARDREAGQFSFFDTGAMSTEAEVGDAGVLDDEVGEWPDRLRLQRERDVLGFYLSGHPTKLYQRAFHRLQMCPCGDLATRWDSNRGWGANRRTTAAVGGLVVGKDIKNIATYSGAAKDETVIPRRAFLVVEDTSGQVEVRMEPEVFTRYEALVALDEPLVFQGHLMARRSGGGDEAQEDQLQVGLNATGVRRAFEVFEEQRVPLTLHTDLHRHSPKTIAELRGLLSRFPGALPPEFRIREGKQSLHLLAAASLSVQCTLEVLDGVEEILGRGGIEIG
jgi:DNA polymerase III subunit alpha